MQDFWRRILNIVVSRDIHVFSMGAWSQNRIVLTLCELFARMACKYAIEECVEKSRKTWLRNHRSARLSALFERVNALAVMWFDSVSC